MDDWPSFVVETPSDETSASRGWEEVVFELEDSLAESDGEPSPLIREKLR